MLIQYIRPHDRRALPLLRRLHALRGRRHTQKLPALRLPLHKLLKPACARVQVLAVLELGWKGSEPEGERRRTGSVSAG